MKIQIKLGNNSKIGSLSSEPFFLLKGEENKLQIEFETDIQSLLMVSLKNGERFKQIIVRDRAFSVPPELICEGELEIIVSLYGRKLAMKRWVCDPISICRAKEEDFEVYSVFQKVAERLDSLERQLQALGQENRMLKNQIVELWQMIEQ